MDEKIFCEEQLKPDLSDDTLTHFGIKGMKWGFRKKKKSGTGRGTGSAESKARRRKGYDPKILTYKPKKALQKFESAMYNDPRFKRWTNGIDVSRDKRFTNGKSAINYNTDKRFQRQGSGINVFYDPRYHGKYKRWN